jgi:geranylgeranyl pyrophosphate synthase
MHSRTPRRTNLYAKAEPTVAEIEEIVDLLERSGAQDFTRAQAQRHRDACLAELDGLDVIGDPARERLRGIIHSVISA